MSRIAPPHSPRDRPKARRHRRHPKSAGRQRSPMHHHHHHWKSPRLGVVSLPRPNQRVRRRLRRMTDHPRRHPGPSRALRSRQRRRPGRSRATLIAFSTCGDTRTGGNVQPIPVVDDNSSASTTFDDRIGCSFVFRRDGRSAEATTCAPELRDNSPKCTLRRQRGDAVSRRVVLL